MTEDEKNYELDEIKDLELTPEQIKDHKTTRRFIRNLENIAVFGGLVIGTLTAVSYGIYKCLPEPAKETINDVCSNLYKYFIPFTS